MQKRTVLALGIFVAGIVVAITTAHSQGKNVAAAKTVTVKTGVTTSSKMCSGVNDPYWRDTITVPDTFTAEGCKGFAQSVGAAHYQLGCIQADSISWGAFNGGNPSPNCGW